MDSSTLYLELQEFLPGSVLVEEPMQKHTSWRIGGPADIFVNPSSREELQLVVSFAHRRDIPLIVIGNGSNLLVAERGIRGIVVKVGSGLSHIATAENIVTAEAGAKLSQVAAAALNAGLGGFEFTAGIPGTMGGAVVMNAGANGSSIGTLVREVLLLNFEGIFYRKTREEMDFGYRTSVLQVNPSIVVETSFLCENREKYAIKADMERFLSKRKSTQPLTYPNAGSVFRNPPGDSAGRLIEMAGLKGINVGDAQISTLHANFIVNLGTATARDVLKLIDRIRETVYRRFGVELQLEVKVIGEE